MRHIERIKNIFNSCGKECNADTRGKALFHLEQLAKKGELGGEFKPPIPGLIRFEYGVDDNGNSIFYYRDKYLKHDNYISTPGKYKFAKLYNNKIEMVELNVTSIKDVPNSATKQYITIEGFENKIEYSPWSNNVLFVLPHYPSGKSILYCYKNIVESSEKQYVYSPINTFQDSFKDSNNQDYMVVKKVNSNVFTKVEAYGTKWIEETDEHNFGFTTRIDTVDNTFYYYPEGNLEF